MAGLQRPRPAVVLAAGALLLASCGSDDPSRALPEVPAEVADTEPEPSVDETAADDATTVVIEHKFGETVIDGVPERVVSVGFNEHDFLLALGVEPVAVRDWYGDHPFGVWPWAQDELGDAEPEVLPSEALNFEQIAALDPDVIVGVWSGMTEQDYELLSAIAPTVAQPAAYADYGTPWQEHTEILGRALGKSDEADAVVAALEEQIAAVRDSNPEWADLTAGVAFLREDGLGVYATQDTRSRFMADLGFTIPEEFDGGGEFFLDVSPEDLAPLDVDVLVWVAGSQDALDAVVTELPTRSSVAAVREGREVFASIEVGGAFSHSSPLSLQFVLDELVPEIELAADGDPTTVVPSAVEIGAVDADGSPLGVDTNPEEARVDVDGGEMADPGEVWALVFDSTAAFAEKAPHLEDAEALVATVDAYAAAGEGFGGIRLEPTDVVIDGDRGTVTYDVTFGGSPAYGDQVGTITLVDGVWTVSRDEFCSFMASARVGCSN